MTPRQPGRPSGAGIDPETFYRYLERVDGLVDDVHGISERLQDGDARFAEMHGDLKGIQGQVSGLLVGIENLSASFQTLTTTMQLEAEKRGQAKAAMSVLEWVRKNWKAASAVALLSGIGSRFDWASIKAWFLGGPHHGP